MTREVFNDMTLDEAIEWAGCEYGAHEITCEETLIQFAKEKLDDNLSLALHILNAVYEGQDDAYCGYYLYDYSLGTLSTPTPITCKEDLLDYITFEEEEI